MSLNFRSIALCCAFVAVTACDDNAIFRDIALILPAGDRNAATDLSRIEVGVWSPPAGACLGLQSWALEVCGDPECGAPWRIGDRVRGARPPPVADPASKTRC